jgi:hypothetical protein
MILRKLRGEYLQRAKSILHFSVLALVGNLEYRVRYVGAVPDLNAHFARAFGVKGKNRIFYSLHDHSLRALSFKRSNGYSPAVEVVFIAAGELGFSVVFDELLRTDFYVYFFFMSWHTFWRLVVYCSLRMILPLLRHLSIPTIYGITNGIRFKKYTKTNAKNELRKGKKNMKSRIYLHKVSPDGQTVNRITRLSNLKNPPAGSGVSMDLVDLETLGAMVIPQIALNRSHLGRVANTIDVMDLEKISMSATGLDWGNEGKSLAKVLLYLVRRTENFLRLVISPDVIRGKIEFNKFRLRKYNSAQFPSGRPYALAPHRDSMRYINVTAVWLLRGKSSFFVCGDKLGRNKKEIKANPGQLILLRGAGYAGIHRGPFHFISRSDEELVMFAMGQAVLLKP